MTELTVLLSKDPCREAGGDITMTRLLLSLVPPHVDLSVACLSKDSAARDDLVVGERSIPVARVAKPPVAPARLMLDAARHGRSLVHERFDVAGMRAYLQTSEPRALLAEHAYMAESWLAVREDDSVPLLVNTVVSEAHVWRAGRSRLLRIESERLRRDELRVARAATKTTTFDEAEAAALRAGGAPSAELLDLSLPPLAAIDVAATGRRLVLLGTRTWRPNAEAVDLAVRWWPRIRAGFPDAELLLVGEPGRRTPRSLPDGVRDLGFVDDLDAVLSGCRAMIAPIRTGGGVRVKILDAVRRGLPVVGTNAAVGSLAGTFGLTPFDDEHDWIARCRELLAAPAVAAAEGRRLHEISAQRWQDGVPHRAVLGLLEPVLG